MVETVIESGRRILYDCEVCGHIMDVPIRKDYISERKIVRVRRNTGAVCCGKEMRSVYYVRNDLIGGKVL